MYCIVAFTSYHMSGVIALISGVICWFIHMHVVLGTKAVGCVCSEIHWFLMLKHRFHSW